MARVKIAHLVYHYGDSFDDYQVIWQDAAGVPINLAGYTATLRIRPTESHTGTLLLELTSSGQGLSINASQGLVDFVATPTKMKSGTLVGGNRYFYDLQVASPAETKTLIKGQFWVDPEVTDA